MILSGRFEEFDEYMPNHTIKEGAWKFGLSYYSVIYWVKKRKINYKHLKDRKIIDKNTGVIYPNARELGKILGCNNNYITGTIAKGHRCRGMDLDYYWD